MQTVNDSKAAGEGIDGGSTNLGNEVEHPRRNLAIAELAGGGRGLLGTVPLLDGLVEGNTNTAKHGGRVIQKLQPSLRIRFVGQVRVQLQSLKTPQKIQQIVAHKND